MANLEVIMECYALIKEVILEQAIEKKESIVAEYILRRG
jgi:hypothetical protein